LQGDLVLKISIINVGVNASHGNLMSPIFDNETFEFVPIPSCSPSECPMGLGNCSDCKEFSVFPKYKNLIPYSKSFTEFLPQSLLEIRTHNDPEFNTFTYGDFPSKSPRASNLMKLTYGDYLFFLARLVNWRNGSFTSRAGFYLVGFLEIERIFKEDELTETVEKRRFDDQFKKIELNGHILMAQRFPQFWLEDVMGWKGSWVFLGSKNSRRFRYAVPFDRALADETMLDAQGRKWTWPENQTELQRIGSYTRSCRIIEDTWRIDKLLETIRLYNKDVPERQD
jgi:hypothetical protein